MTASAPHPDRGRPCGVLGGRLLSFVDVGGVLLIVATLTVGYFVAVTHGFGDLSYVTVGKAFLLGTDGLLLVFTAGRRPAAVGAARRRSSLMSR